jgi:hypothetical protein
MGADGNTSRGSAEHPHRALRALLGADHRKLDHGACGVSAGSNEPKRRPGPSKVTVIEADGVIERRGQHGTSFSIRYRDANGRLVKERLGQVRQPRKFPESD